MDWASGLLQCANSAQDWERMILLSKVAPWEWYCEPEFARKAGRLLQMNRAASPVIATRPVGCAEIFARGRVVRRGQQVQVWMGVQTREVSVLNTNQPV